MKLFFALLLIIPAISLADCPLNVDTIKQGAPAPCNGWIVSEPTMQEMARNKELLTIEQERGLRIDKIHLLDEQEIEFFRARSKNLAVELDKSESRRFWQSLGMFTLGVVLTGVAAKAAIESSK